MLRVCVFVEFLEYCYKRAVGEIGAGICCVAAEFEYLFFWFVSVVSWRPGCIGLIMVMSCVVCI